MNRLLVKAVASSSSVLRLRSSITQPILSVSWFSAQGTGKEEEPANPLDVARPITAGKKFLEEVDTTLTPEQQKYVDELKQKYLKSSGSKYSPYRDVPSVEEQEKFPNMQYRPYIPENAEALIDWALSHVPERGGYRGTRAKKRMAHRWEQKRRNDAHRKTGELKSHHRRHERFAYQNDLAAMYRTQAEGGRFRQVGGPWAEEAAERAAKKAAAAEAEE
jgi:hypothetical protein